LNSEVVGLCVADVVVVVVADVVLAPTGGETENAETVVRMVQDYLDLNLH
jgi:hypothetical protein